MNQQSLQKQSGVALVTVMIIFFLVVMLASQLLSRSTTDIERTDWLVSEAQAYQYALGGEALARIILIDQFNQLKEQGLNISPVLRPLPVYKPDNGNIAIEIVDLQGLLNLNNASATTKQAPVNALLDFFGIKAILPQIQDWIDTDSSTRANGAEDSFYRNTFPYIRPANRFMLSPTELRALAGIQPETFQRLEKWTTTLPEETEINVNTAPAELFLLIKKDLDGEKIVQQRKVRANGFESTQEFLALPELAGEIIEDDLITVNSSYFVFRIIARFGERNVWLYSQAHVDPNNKTISIMSRTLGKQFDINSLSDGTDLTEDGQPTDTSL